MADKGKFLRTANYFAKQRDKHLDSAIAAHEKSAAQISAITNYLDILIGGKEVPQLRSQLADYTNVRGHITFDIGELKKIKEQK